MTYVVLVRAFRLGLGFIVEVDIVLPEDMSLREAHDIGEALQMKLEQVCYCFLFLIECLMVNSAILQVNLVERAFVHLDYETDHQPEHKNAKKVVDLGEEDD
jgi:hypothetical protein